MGKRNTSRNELQERTQLRRMLDEMPAMVILIDLNGRLRWANRRSQKILNLPTQEIREAGADVFQFPDTVGRQRWSDFVRSATGEWTRFRLRGRGTQVVDSFWAAMSLPGGEVAFVGVEAGLGTAVQPGSDVPAETLDAEGQARTQANLALSLAEVRELHLRLAETEQAERSHISRHLHDVLGGDLTSLSLSLAEVLPSLEDGNRARRVLAQCLETVEQLGSKVRDVMAELQPPMLEEFGIAATLRWLGHRFAQRSGIVTRVRASESVPRLSRIKETVLVRIVGEALSNLRNHAEAANAWVTLYFNANLVRLTVTDDGIGFAGKTLSNSGEWNGWGIVGMRERATAVGGTLRIESALGRGTRVIAEIPR